MLSIRNLNFKYGNRPILKNVSFDAPAGSCIAILGNNGVGKSTLIKCFNKILKPLSGEVILNDRNISSLSRIEIAREIAYVAQYSETSRFTVFDTILLGRKPYIKFSPTKKDYEIVKNIIKKMGLSHMALRFINELSGGEVQKIMLARALAQQPKVLLLDEPTSNLDIKNQHDMLELVRNIAKRENICVIIVIHDLNLAIRYCDYFVLLKNGTVYAEGGEEIINADTIKNVYGMNATIEKIHGMKIIIPNSRCLHQQK